jgi:integrase
MATNELTEKTILAALKQAQREGRPVKASDGEGMHLEAQPNGRAWWRLRYRFGGRETMLSLGTYPDTTLAQARRNRALRREQLAAGIDPSEAKRAEVEADKADVQARAREAAGLPPADAFSVVAREWHAVHATKTSASYALQVLRNLERDVFPWIGLRPVHAVEADEVLAVLRRVEARGAVETTRRLRHTLGQVFSFAGRNPNPAAHLGDKLRAAAGRHHAAIVDPAAAGELLRAMADYRGTPVTRIALALSALLFLRPGELRQAEWAWIDLDGHEPTLTLPSSLMKRRREKKASGAPHVVPLAPQAVAHFRELHALTGSGRYCFPAAHTTLRPMSENTVNVALRRMGFDRDTATAHGFRAMARTLAAERLGVDPLVIEAQLAHAVPDRLGTAYNRALYLPQRRELMVKWAAYLDRLREGAKVIPLPAGRASTVTA